MVKITNKRYYWLNGEKLVCPHLRGFNFYWVALNKDPCPDCKNIFCHNQGIDFDRSDKLIIVKWKGERRK